MSFPVCKELGGWANLMMVLRYFYLSSTPIFCQVHEELKSFKLWEKFTTEIIKVW